MLEVVDARVDRVGFDHVWLCWEDGTASGAISVHNLIKPVHVCVRLAARDRMDGPEAAMKS